MSLTSALNTAKSSLSAIQTQTALVSRNIANVNTEGATRKYANVVTGTGGRVEVRSIAQSSDSVLFRNMLDSTSDLQKTTVVQGGLTRIEEMIGDIENGQTPAALIGALSDKLKAYAASPNSADFARSAADAASDIVTALNQGAQTVYTIRRDADTELSNAASDMRDILATIEDLNTRVVAGTAANRDITDIVDQRDQAVAKLSQYVGVTMQTRANNDLVLYTDSGVTLFDRSARQISFAPTHPIVDGEDGNGFRIDGVLVTGDNAMMPIKSGKIAGLVDLRDNVAVTYQSQLDEMARGLVAATAERPATGADVPGIFTAEDPATLATTNSVTVGQFAAGTLADGNVLSFDLQLGQTTYQISGAVSTADLASAGAFAARLQAMIAAGVPSGGTGTLGTGHVSVSAGAGGALTFTAGGVGGKLAIAVSNLSSKDNAGATTTHSPARTDGLTSATAPQSNAVIPGLARLLRLSSVVSGDATAMRDGVAADYNPTNLAGFTDRINDLVSSLGASQAYAPGTGAVTSGGLTAFAASSTSWLQDRRSQASSDTEYKQTLLDRTKETLSNGTGVNLDTESLLMLDLERSYQASSKVLTTVDQMLKTLMDAI